MSLRNRFRLLLAVFGVSVLANVLVSVWCIRVYVDSATQRFDALMTGLVDAEQVRGLIDELLAELGDRIDRAEDMRDTRYRMLYHRIQQRVQMITATDEEGTEEARMAALRSCADRLGPLSEAVVQDADAGNLAIATRLLNDDLVSATAGPMHTMLAEYARTRSTSMNRSSTDIERTQRMVTSLLASNAIFAILLTSAGVYLVRNWLLRPIEALQAAAEHHAAGHLEYRVVNDSSDELGALAREVNRMAESLTAIQQKLVEQERLAAIGEVTSAVAHNLRNPLAGIRAIAQASLSEDQPQEETEQGHYRIIEMVDSLSRWMRDLLMVSKPIEVNRQRVAVQTLATRVIEVLAAHAQRRHQTTVLDAPAEPVMVTVDPARIEQALLAVVDNALDASPTGATVCISVATQPDRENRIVLSVFDNGPGIEPHVLARIASPYFSTKPGGTGIGLHLARRTLQAHGGSLAFEPNPEGGTIVRLLIPRDPPAQLAGPIGPRSTA